LIQEIYYSVGDYRTYSKIDAFRVANGDPTKVSFEFLETGFQHVNWNRPLDSWSDLLGKRCQQLRDKYDWLVLWFSGGWDSTTVLDAFVANQIPLDEILIYNRTWFQDPEIGPALQYAQEIKQQHMPGLKITLVDIDGRDSDEVYKRLGSDWIFTPGCSIMYPKMHRYFLFHEIGKSAREIKKTPNIGTIHAQDKPKVLIADGKWKNFQPDGGMYQYMNVDCEFFYITPELPELHVAQCHMAVDYYESLIKSMGIPGLRHYHDLQSNLCQDWRYEMLNKSIGRSCINHESPRFGLLKQRVHQNPMGDESVRGFWHARDNNNQAWKIYQDGIKSISEITGIAIPTTGNDNWLPGINSRKWYTLRPVSTEVSELISQSNRQNGVI
jgi:hypothetical protein